MRATIFMRGQYFGDDRGKNAEIHERYFDRLSDALDYAYLLAGLACEYVVVSDAEKPHAYGEIQAILDSRMRVTQ